MIEACLRTHETQKILFLSVCVCGVLIRTAAPLYFFLRTWILSVADPQRSEEECGFLRGAMGQMSISYKFKGRTYTSP